MTDRRRELPSVDRLLREPRWTLCFSAAPRAVVWRPSARRSLRRAPGGPDHPTTGRPRSASASSSAPVPSSGRCSTPPASSSTPTSAARRWRPPPWRAMAAIAAGYSNLELDLDTGTRGSRTDHCRELLRRLTGAEDALVVNNAAGALVLALNALAAGRDVADLAGRADRDRRLVPDSRHHGPERRSAARGRHHQPHPPGRLPAGARCRRGRHPHGAPIQLRAARLRRVARAGGAGGARGGGGRSLPLRRGQRAAGGPGAVGPRRRSHAWPTRLAAGADLVLFSGDKLLGGPQAGCLVGRQALLARCRENPFARAMRADKLTLAALEATLALYEDPETAVREIPVLRMLTLDAAALAVAGRTPRGRLSASAPRRAPAGRVGGRRRRLSGCGSPHHARGARSRARSAPTAWRSGSGWASRPSSRAWPRAACCSTRARCPRKRRRRSAARSPRRCWREPAAGRLPRSRRHPDRGPTLSPGPGPGAPAARRGRRGAPPQRGRHPGRRGDQPVGHRPRPPHRGRLRRHRPPAGRAARRQAAPGSTPTTTARTCPR